MAAEHVERMGARIRELREKAGLTQKELAELIPGKTDSTQVSKWERGKNRPLDDTLEHIARALNCDVGVFHASEPEEASSPDLMGALTTPGDLAQRLDQIDERGQRIEAMLEQLLETAFQRELEDADLQADQRESGSGEGAGGSAASAKA